jgi:hypothetical protein
MCFYKQVSVEQVDVERHLRLKRALVHQNSCECTKSELDMFGVPPTQTSVEHGYWEQKKLTSTLTDQGASRPKVLAPLFNKGTADLNRLLSLPATGTILKSGT